MPKECPQYSETKLFGCIAELTDYVTDYPESAGVVMHEEALEMLAEIRQHVIDNNGISV